MVYKNKTKGSSWSPWWYILKLWDLVRKVSDIEIWDGKKTRFCHQWIPCKYDVEDFNHLLWLLPFCFQNVGLCRIMVFLLFKVNLLSIMKERLFWICCFEIHQVWQADFLTIL